MPPANTRECVLQHRGKTVIGVLCGALPLNRGDLSSSTTSVLFDDGSALTFAGAFWTDSPQDVEVAVERLRRQLAETADLTAETLRLAGKLADAKLA